MAFEKKIGKKTIKSLKNCNAHPCRLLGMAGWLKWLK